MAAMHSEGSGWAGSGVDWGDMTTLLSHSISRLPTWRRRAVVAVRRHPPRADACRPTTARRRRLVPNRLVQQDRPRTPSTADFAVSGVHELQYCGR